MIDDNTAKVATAIQIKNSILLVCTVALVLGLYAMSGSWHSLWGLSLLLFYSITSSEMFKSK